MARVARSRAGPSGAPEANGAVETRTVLSHTSVATTEAMGSTLVPAAGGGMTRRRTVTVIRPSARTQPCSVR